MPASSSSRAASILRASLNRRTAEGSQEGSTDRNNNASSLRRAATHDATETHLSYAVDDGADFLDVDGEVGVDVIFAADADPRGPMHPLGEEALSLSQHNSSNPRKATSLFESSMREEQLRVRDNLANTKAASIPMENHSTGTGENVTHGSSLLDRLALSLPSCPSSLGGQGQGRGNMRCVALVACSLALVGVIVATGVSSARGGGGRDSNNDLQQATKEAHGPGWVAVPDVLEDPAPGSGPAAGGNGPDAVSWLQNTRLEDPNLRALGSTVSFSADATHLAISAKQSQTIQVRRRRADGRSWDLVDRPLPGTAAVLSADGHRIAVADAAESTVTTYELHRGEWVVYGTRIIDIWGARSVSLSADGTSLAVAHNADAICRICPSVATVFELSSDASEWIQQDDVLGAYDFDFNVKLSWDATTLVFSGRVYEKNVANDGSSGSSWSIKSSFPDFITAHSTLSGDGRAVAVSLPDCHIFKNVDPAMVECTNVEKYEVSVLEYESSTGSGGWWNRKGVSIGPEMAAHEGTTGIALSEDGDTVAIAVGNRGEGGEAAVHVGDAIGMDAPKMDPSPLTMNNDQNIDELPIQAGRNHGENSDETNWSDDWDKYANYGHNLRRGLQKSADYERRRNLDELNWSEDWDQYQSTAYESDNAFVRVYRYDETTGDWHVIGEDIALDTSGATVTLSADGSTLAIGVPYGGGISSGYVKIYDLIAQ